MEIAKNIPDALAILPQWVCWGAKGKPRKMPFDPRTGTPAKAGQPETWADFQTAAQAVEAGRFGGVGFEFDAAGCVVGIDFDHCLHDGKCDPWVEAWVTKLDSYTEISPSGEGLHVFCSAHLPGQAIKRKEAEMYDRGRYFTMTGRLYGPEKPLRAAQDTVNALYAELQARAQKQQQERPTEKPTAAPGGVDIEDAPLIAKMKKGRNGAAFSALWNGDISAYPSHSEADVALCNILAWWTNGDPARMDRLFRQSGLMREKWDRKQSGTTYGAITIKNAASSTRGGYDPAGYFKERAAKVVMPVSAPAEDPGTKSAQPAQVSLTDLEPDNNDRYGWNDIGNGNLFADWYKRVARYVPERKQWFVYADGVWKPDTGGLKVMQLCKKLADSLYIYALSIPDESRKQSYMKHVAKWQSRHNRETILKDAASVYPLPLSRFDADPFLFNCQNGTLNLKTREFRDHSPADFLSMKAGVEYHANARCKRWEQFISEIMQGDQDKAAFFQKALGYALTGDTAHECFFILYGVTSRNGKGTSMETFMNLVGDYGRATRPETISMKPTVNGNMPSEDVARLAGARFVNISEPDKKMVLSAALVKTLTGNDTITARFLHENSFEFRPQFKLFINTNHLPQVTDVTLFTSGRVKLIPFERHFDESERDTGLKKALSTPAALSGILNWCLDGLWLIEETGFDMPESVKIATDEYRQRSDKMGRFVAESLEADPQGEIRTEDAYELYKAWCARNGQFAESMANFKSEMENFGTIKRKRPAGSGSTAQPKTFILGYKQLRFA